MSCLVNLTLSTDGRCLNDEGRFLKPLNDSSASKGTPVLAMTPKRTGLIVAPSQCRLTGKNIFIFCWRMTSNILKNDSKKASIITCHHQSSPSKTSAQWGELQGSGARASLFMSAMDTYGQSLEKKIPRNVRKFNDKLIWIDCWLLNPYLHLTLKGD